ncbi:hypothetical protein M0L20_28650 [Spirosoma sp. RP8]|uniref:Uncharacterized protein n=1 Tax=Spirosoma liriopis TaxID=2937440 RepID=A0ABT0HUK5_9BACT|nr:hypothetical protein [Spirosoma liriopis]MCK8495870.1 hypothetical protein [Spirosoma liriopis]
MDVNTILGYFQKDKTISDEVIDSIQNNSVLRIDLVNYFREHNYREFAIALLNAFVVIRQKPNGEMPTEDLMLACYLVGLHQQVEDSLTIWETKNTDFDTYCGLDIQLVPFAGVIQTLEFLKNQQNKESKKAFDYVQKCYQNGDFNSIDEYYSDKMMPWFVSA